MIRPPRNPFSTLVRILPLLLVALLLLGGCNGPGADAGTPGVWDESAWDQARWR